MIQTYKFRVGDELVSLVCHAVSAPTVTRAAELLVVTSVYIRYFHAPYPPTGSVYVGEDFTGAGVVTG